MTNKSIRLIMAMEGKNIIEKQLIIKEILSVEFDKIKAQAKIFEKNSNEENELVKGVTISESSEELFEYLNKLSVIEISLLDAYGIDVDVMNILKVSE